MSEADPYCPPPEVVAFAKEWVAQLNEAITRRMQTVGVPEEMIGIHGMPYEAPGAFVLTHAIGGANNHIPGTGILGREPGINVDMAVLDVRFARMRKVKSWAEARLKDRIDAVIAHEYTEVLVAQPAPSLTLHQHAIKFAPETDLKIAERAREILRDYRRSEGLE